MCLEGTIFLAVVRDQVPDFIPRTKERSGSEQSICSGPYTFNSLLSKSSSDLLACYLVDLHPSSPLPLTSHLSALKYHHVLKCERSPGPITLVRCI